MILMRRLASQLTMPVVIVDPAGDLVFFNAAAALILGRAFEDAGPILRGDWSSLFKPANPDGSPMKREDLPLWVATEHREPCHRRGWVRGLNGVVRELDGVAFPLTCQGDRMLGAVGMFWDIAAMPPPGVSGEGVMLDLAAPGGDRPVELLLMRQVSSYLRTAIYLLGPDGSVLFYNEPAERLLGRRFDEAEPMGVEEWSTLLEPTDAAGKPITVDERPMIIAWRKQQPAHRRFWIRSFDGVPHDIEGLAFPLVGHAARQLGAVGVFWEHTKQDLAGSEYAGS
jgi:PAS domain-containing protein